MPKLNVEAPDEIEKKLKEAGYSESAVEEILKWYKKNNNKKT